MVAVQQQQPDAAPPVVLVDPATSFDGGFFLPAVELVVDRSIQTRHDRDPAVVAGILSSMKARLSRGHHPQEMPVWVTRHGNRWLLLAGFTRHELLEQLAAEMRDADVPEEARRWLERPTIWCVQKHAPTPYRAIVENLRENLGRQNLSIADETEAMARLQDLDPTRPLAEIAADLDRSTRGVSNLLRAYRELPPEMWGAFRRGTLPQRAAIKLAGMKDANERRKAFELLTDPEARKKAREAKAAAKAEAASASRVTPAVGDASGARVADEGEPRDAWGGTVDELYTIGVRARHAMRALEFEKGGSDLDAPYLDGIRDVLTYIETADLGVLRAIREHVQRLQAASAGTASAEKATPAPDLHASASASASAQAPRKLHRRDPHGQGARCNYRITDPARLTDNPDLVGCDTCAGRVGYSGGEKPKALVLDDELDGASAVTTWTRKATTAALLERAKNVGRYRREELEATAEELGCRRRNTESSAVLDGRIDEAINCLRLEAASRGPEAAAPRTAPALKVGSAKAAKAAKAPKAANAPKAPKAARRKARTKGR
ncbi:hypothetical protein L6R52_41485 [Myxococcota bacterium]|nr:hypothetical protein [Myxococcota bacterium]